MMTNDDMDGLFHALAHQVRRRILDILRDRPGITVGELAREFDVSRIAVMNHLAVLSDAGLVVSDKRGRSRCLWINVMPIRAVYDRWTDTFSDHWADRASQIKRAAEAAVFSAERMSVIQRIAEASARSRPKEDDHD